MADQLQPEGNPDLLFEQLRGDYPADSSRPRRGFGSDALTVDGRIFAALSRGKLLVKLPRSRVEELISAGAAEPFVLRERMMREWLLVLPEEAALWPALIKEAHRFVSGD